MASKNMVEEQRPYASKKEAAIHTTVTVELHNIFQKVAHKKNLTMAQAARAAILDWLRAQAPKTTASRGAARDL